jgi:phage baseplate assembly protein V
MSHLKGLVEAVDGRGFVKVRLPEHGVVTDWLPVVQRLAHKAWDMALPRVGSQVALLPGLDLDDAIVLGCLPSSLDQPPITDPLVHFLTFEDGTRISYDPTAKALMIAAPLNVKVTCTTFELTGTLKLVGDLNQTGNQQVSGNVVTGGTNSAHHTHPVSGNVAQPVP